LSNPIVADETHLFTPLQTASGLPTTERSLRVCWDSILLPAPQPHIEEAASPNVHSAARADRCHWESLHRSGRSPTCSRTEAIQRRRRQGGGLYLYRVNDECGCGYCAEADASCRTSANSIIFQRQHECSVGLYLFAELNPQICGHCRAPDFRRVPHASCPMAAPWRAASGKRNRSARLSATCSCLGGWSSSNGSSARPRFSI
jgi:hypothetical protein